jgi:hypothetical protein
MQPLSEQGPVDRTESRAMAYWDTATTAMRFGLIFKSIKINNLKTKQGRRDLAGGAAGSKSAIDKNYR